MGKRRNDPLRVLARSTKYQNIYSMAKELHGVQLFENVSDFSKIQLNFLYWLSVYHRLYEAKALKENQFIQDLEFDSDFAVDCYLIWEDKQRKKPVDKKDEKKKKKEVDPNNPIGRVVFTRGI